MFSADIEVKIYYVYSDAEGFLDFKSLVRGRGKILKVLVADIHSSNLLLLFLLLFWLSLLADRR